MAWEALIGGGPWGAIYGVVKGSQRSPFTPEQPGYRGSADQIYDQRQAGATMEQIVASGILDTSYAPTAGASTPSAPPAGDNAPTVVDPERPSPGGGSAEVIDPVEGYGPTIPEAPGGSAIIPEIPRDDPWIPEDIGFKAPGGPGIDPWLFAAQAPHPRGRGRGRGIPSPFPSPFPFPMPAEPAAPPDSGEPDPETGRERPPLFPPGDAANDPELPPEPANDTSIRRPPVQQVEPVRVPDPMGVRAPFPERPPSPAFPPYPVLPDVSTTVPRSKPEWPAPQSFPSSVTAPASVPSPSVPAPVTGTPSTPSTSTPRTTPSFPSPRAIAITAPFLLGALSLLRSGARSPTQSALSSAAPSPISPPSSRPAPTVTPVTGTLPLPVPQPGAQPAPVALPVPQATPISTPSALQASPSCETPTQRRDRQRRQRDACERFITIKVPAHKRRVCAAEAGRILGRKLGKKIGRAIGKKVGEVTGFTKATKPVRAALRRARAATRVRKSIEIGGGIGVEIPKELRQRIPRIPGAPG